MGPPTNGKATPLSGNSVCMPVHSYPGVDDKLGSDQIGDNDNDNDNDDNDDDDEDSQLSDGDQGSVGMLGDYMALGGQESIEWQETIGNVVPTVVSIRFCLPCSFDSDFADTSEATGFVVDAERG